MPVGINGAGSIAGLAAGINGVGKVLQVVSVAFPASRTVSAGTWVDLTGWSLSITPTAATSRFVCVAGIETTMGFPTGNVYNTAFCRIARTLSGSDTQIASAEMYLQQSGGPYITSYPSAVSLLGVDTPNTTSALTYKIQGGRATNDVTYYARGGNALVVMEIAA